MERELKNGKRYRFTEIFRDYIRMEVFEKDRWNPNSKDFRTWGEVEEFCNKINYDAEHPKPIVNIQIPSDYYGRPGVYYGD